MARLKKEEKELLLADFHTGHYTQRDLAKKYKVSTATVSSHTKGVIPENLDKVNALVSINAELSEQSEQKVNAVHDKVNKLSKDTELIHKLTKLNLKDMSDKLSDGLVAINDNKLAQDTIDKASITLGVNQRHAPKGDINSNNNQQINEIVGYEVKTIE